MKNTTTVDSSAAGDYDIVSEVFASISITQRAMATKSGVFQTRKDGNIIFQQWKCFVSSLLHKTKGIIPQEGPGQLQNFKYSTIISTLIS